jgi:hypothetical protein
MSGYRYSVYAVMGGKFLRSDFRRFAPLCALLGAAARAAMMGGKVVTITIEHPGACRDSRRPY